MMLLNINIIIILSIIYLISADNTSEQANKDSDEINTEIHKKTLNCSCGWTNRVRELNGENRIENKYPFMAGIIILESKILFCSAVILTMNHAITSSSCTLLNKGKNLGLVVGIYNISTMNENTEILSIKRTIEHDDFNNNTYFDDIALIVLSKSIKFTRLIGPVCLPLNVIDLQKEYVYFLGWSNSKHGVEKSTSLMEYNLRVVRTNYCAEHSTSKIEDNIEKQFCTIGQKHDSCEELTSGPVIWFDPEINRFTLIGLMSYGKCKQEEPTVNLNISHYLHWIQRKISSSGLDGQTCTKIEPIGNSPGSR